MSGEHFIVHRRASLQLTQLQDMRETAELSIEANAGRIITSHFYKVSESWVKQVVIQLIFYCLPEQHI